MHRFELFTGDCRTAMLFMEDSSIDSVVCDPPYGISFMAKHWDYDVPTAELWADCLRVLKPGAHLLAFFSTRTYHRGVTAIEDAGFEIRDTTAWVYGSGFPKSMDVSKAIDKAAGAEREVIGRSENGISGGSGKHAGETGAYGFAGEFNITAPATDAARQWQGWGTALKPAMELIVIARKPLVGTVVENVLVHGTGGLNIAGCRVGDEVLPATTAGQSKIGTFERGVMVTPARAGRFPANLIHDGSPEVVDLFPDSNGAGPSLPRVKITGYGGGVVGSGASEYLGGERTPFNSGSGSAARFFYCPKASRKDRGATNGHPTVKPTDLMAYLCRLVTPPGGLVFDPFMGSGSTGKAAIREGFRFIGCDLSPEYVAIAEARISHEAAIR